MSQELILRATPAQWAEVLAEIQKLPSELQPRYLQAARQHMEEQHGRTVPTVTIPLPAPTYRFGYVAYAIVLALLIPLALIAVGGGISTMYGVLSTTAKGWGPALRAVSPFALEAIFFHGAYTCLLNQTAAQRMGPPRWFVAFACLCVVGFAVRTELVTSASAPEVAKRERLERAFAEAQAAAAKAAQVTTTDALESEGQVGKARHEKVQLGKLDLAAGQLAYAQQIGQQQITNASTVTRGEAEGPTDTAICGALGGATVTVLLELFLKALGGLGATRKRA